MKKARLLLLAMICTLYVGKSNAQNGIVVPPWQMYEGDKIPVKGKVTFKEHGDAAAFSVIQVPAPNAPGWKPAEYGKDGEVTFDRKSDLPCDFSVIKPTFFQTTVMIPKGMKVNSFKVYYIKADDGARIYVNGQFKPEADLTFNKQQTRANAIDLSSFAKEGENRVVIAQYDDCGGGNSLHGIDIEVNGKEVTPKMVAPTLPTRFRLHAYSISGKRVEKGSDYWMGFDEKAQKVNAANNNAKYYDGKIVSPKNATIMEFERVDIDKEKGIIMLKLANNPDPKVDLYLQVGDDKNVTLYPGTAKSGRGYFYVRVPEEKEAGDLNFVSLETAGYPSNGGWFLRHEGYGLKVTPGDVNTRKNVVYRQDATWLFEPVK